MDISGLKERWHPLKPVPSKALRQVLRNQHEALQPITMATWYLLPTLPENAQSSLNFSYEKKLFYAGPIQGDHEYYLGFNVKDLTLEILSDKLELVTMADLNNHTTSEAYNFIEK